ncbi:hypothetical protein N9L68_02730 [bacterium]|nr:hypothetical protein [bacterium]
MEVPAFAQDMSVEMAQRVNPGSTITTVPVEPAPDAANTNDAADSDAANTNDAADSDDELFVIETNPSYVTPGNWGICMDINQLLAAINGPTRNITAETLIGIVDSANETGDYTTFHKFVRDMVPRGGWVLGIHANPERIVRPWLRLDNTALVFEVPPGRMI